MAYQDRRVARTPFAAESFMPFSPFGNFFHPTVFPSARRAAIEKMSGDEDNSKGRCIGDQRRQCSTKMDENVEKMQVDESDVKEDGLLEAAERGPRIDVKVLLLDGETVSAACHQPLTEAAAVFHTLLFAYGRGELICDDDGFGIPYSLNPVPAGVYTYKVTAPPGR